MPHPWRHSKPGWMWLWAAWSSGWQPCIAGGLKFDDHCGPFQPRPFYDSMMTNQQFAVFEHFWLLQIDTAFELVKDFFSLEPLEPHSNLSVSLPSTATDLVGFPKAEVT